MQKNENILEVADNIIVLKNRLKTVTKLKEKAFVPCSLDICYDLDELDEFQQAWEDLFCLDYAKWYFFTYYSDLNNNFNKLRVAFISRKEFCEDPAVVAACEGVEKCINKLKEKISEEEKKLNTLYNKFVKKTGDLSFIFKDPKIKHIIINELLLS